MLTRSTGLRHSSANPHSWQDPSLEREPGNEKHDQPNQITIHFSPKRHLYLFLFNQLSMIRELEAIAKKKRE
jgi:hypothetical protein